MKVDGGYVQEVDSPRTCVVYYFPKVFLEGDRRRCRLTFSGIRLASTSSFEIFGGYVGQQGLASKARPERGQGGRRAEGQEHVVCVRLNEDPSVISPRRPMFISFCFRRRVEALLGLCMVSGVSDLRYHPSERTEFPGLVEWSACVASGRG